ncbi:MAG: hypothetical protein ACFE8N_11120 [Promethearchaeota archaeon]
MRRVVRRLNRGIRRVSRKVTRYQKTFAKTDPKMFNAIKAASTKSMKEVLDGKGDNWVREKKIKQDVKNKVAIEIERELQQSPMNDMRTLVDKTMDETINLALLEEMKKRGPALKITRVPPIGRYLGLIIFPIITAGILGAASFYNPDKIPPGNLVILGSLNPPPGGNPPPIDPIQVAQSTIINIAAYGMGALALAGLIMLLRRK